MNGRDCSIWVDIKIANNFQVDDMIISRFINLISMKIPFYTVNILAKNYNFS